MGTGYALTNFPRKILIALPLAIVRVRQPTTAIHFQSRNLLIAHGRNEKIGDCVACPHFYRAAEFEWLDW